MTKLDNLRICQSLLDQVVLREGTSVPYTRQQMLS